MAPITFPKPGKADAAPSSAATKSVEDLKAEVQDRINQIHATEQEQSAYLSSDDIAELQKMENLLQGSLSLLEQFEKTGGLMPATTAIDTAGGPQLSSVNMKTGWNGGFQSDTSDPSYDEVIMPFNQGTDVKNGLIFKMDDTMETVKGKNIGTDIKVTVTYKDKTEKTYLIKGMVTNPTPLIIAADQTTVGVTVDFSQVKRVGVNDPKVPDVTILGGSGGDTLIGSQGNDQIYGNSGDDFIYGMGGINYLDGGLGSDEIHSVNKSDTISGGDGYDKVVATDKNAASAAKFVETTTLTETVPVDDENFTGTGWTAEEKNGELSISKQSGTTDGGAINLTVPDGVMVYSKQDGEDLVLTYQQIGEDGLPGETQVVRLHDVLNGESRAKITITSESSPNHPSVIDLGGINTQYNQITLKKGQGDDVIIAPKTALDGYGINADDIGKSTLDKQSTQKINDAMEKDSKHHWATGDNGDAAKDFPGWKTKPKVESGEITLYPKDGTEILDLEEPDMAGYSLVSSVAQDSDTETTITLFMQKDGSDQVEQLVLHVMKTDKDHPKTITVGSSAPHDAALATQLIANDDDTGGGVFVGSAASTDKTKAGANKVIDK